MLLDTAPVAARISRAARNLGPRNDGWVLGFHPVARMNPFQALLYSRGFASGFAPVGLVNRTDFPALKPARSMGVGAILHLHWTSEVTAGSEEESEAVTRADDFLQELQALQEEGVRLVWSVHNVLPHKCLFPEVEARFRSDLAELVDVIHVMAEETISETLAHYELPESKIVQVPHPSYVGAYPDHLDRSYVRFEMGYDTSDLVLGAIGSIQPYKGLSEFATATRNVMRKNARLRALVGGLPGRDEESRKLVLELQQMGHIELVARRLSDLELASLMTALDAAVLPYRASLNSGAAMLALSFGVPIVAPMTGSFRRLIERGFGTGYELDDASGLETAIEALPGLLENFDREGAFEFVRSLSGRVISKRFFSRLREALD